ncbi:MAG TPA: hypothetical protein VIY29_07510, partial [Ktedonobacteraceae bacterium]
MKKMILYGLALLITPRCPWMTVTSSNEHRSFLLIRKLILLCGLVAIGGPVANAQTQTYTGTIKDLTGTAVTSGKITFTLTPSTDSTVSGTARFVATVVSCGISATGNPVAISDGVSACTVTSNLALSPTGTSYRICIQAYFATPGSCFHDYALGGTKDISTIAPTLSTGPINYGGVQGPPGPIGPVGPVGGAANIDAGTVLHVPAYKTGGTGLQQTPVTVDASGNMVTTSTNNVSNVCSYPGATLQARLTAAEAAWNGVPVTLEVNQQCSGAAATLSANYGLQDNHNLKIAQGMTISIAGGFIVPGQNSQISGSGDSSVFKLLPSAGNNSYALYVSNSMARSINASGIYAHDFLIDANTDAFVAAGIGGNYNRAIRIGADDSTHDGPNHILFQNIHIINTNRTGVLIAGGNTSTSHTHDITFDRMTFNNSYLYSYWLLGLGLDNITLSNSTFYDYERPWTIPVTGATASGTVATLTFPAPGIP